MNSLSTYYATKSPLSQVVRGLCCGGTVFLLSLSLFSTNASAQPPATILAGSEVSDEQVFHLITAYQSGGPEKQELLWPLFKLKASTLDRHILHLTALKNKWSKVAEALDQSANEKQRESDALEQKLNTPSNQDSNSSGDVLLVLSVDAAETLYLQSQTERLRISWEIAAEEATLETMKKLAGHPQASDMAVLEGKVRAAEAALKTSKDLFDSSSEKYKVGMIKGEELLQSEGNHQKRVVELEIAQAELGSQGAPSRAISEARVRLAETALASAKKILDYHTELYKVGMTKSELLQQAQGDYQQRVIELDIARAEMSSQDSPNAAVLDGKVQMAEVALQAAQKDLADKQKLFNQKVLSQSELATTESQLQMRVIELEIAKAELRSQSQQAAVSSSDAVVKSLLNLAQLKARDQVLKTQLQQLAKAKLQMVEVERLRSAAGNQRVLANRYVEMAPQQQTEIDKLEALKEELDAVIKSNTEDQEKAQESK